MRSGFVAGDAGVIKKFLLYRTYHGCAMSPTVQAASVAAWKDEAHVGGEPRHYREKFEPLTPLLKTVLDVELPDAASTCGLGDARWPDPEFRGGSTKRRPSRCAGQLSRARGPWRQPRCDRVRIALVARRRGMCGSGDADPGFCSHALTSVRVTGDE